MGVGVGVGAGLGVREGCDDRDWCGRPEIGQWNCITLT